MRRIGRRRAVASKKNSGHYPAAHAALGGRTLKTGQSRWFVGYKKHTLRLWLSAGSAVGMVGVRTGERATVVPGIRPHGLRGVTTEKNLISLCHTCHVGLEPHYEFTVFNLIVSGTRSTTIQAGRRCRSFGL